VLEQTASSLQVSIFDFDSETMDASVLGHQRAGMQGCLHHFTLGLVVEWSNVLVEDQALERYWAKHERHLHLGSKCLLEFNWVLQIILQLFAFVSFMG